MASLSNERMELMGKPHIGPVRYLTAKSYEATITEPCCCEVCGRPATNAHHLVPKGIGGGSRHIKVNGETLRSPCIAVCGMGNASGCHRDFHDGLITVRWKWDRERDRDMYLKGYLKIPPHSAHFYKYGCYVMSFADGSEEVYR